MKPLGKIEKCKKEHCNNSRHGELFIPCNRISRTSRTYTISGIPDALKRPRYNKQHVYDSQKHIKLIKGIEIINQHGDDKPYTGILHFDMDFYFPLPKNISERKRLLLKQYHTYRPDLSNLIKMVEDICVDAKIIEDDCIISSVFSRKLYDEGESCTKFIITQINFKEDNGYE